MLAAAGWQVLAGVRRAEDGEALRERSGGALRAVTLDVTDEQGIPRAADRVAELTDGSLTALVNNAGIALGGPIEYLPVDTWRRQFDVNVFGHLAVTRALLPQLRRAPGARVVFIGSIGGRLAPPLLGPYSSSKAAIASIAATLRQELRPSGIGVVLVEPGAVHTPIWGKGRQTADEVEEELGREATERYSWAIAGMRKNIDMQDRSGVPPESVAEVVQRALTTGRPRARYVVGRDAVAMAAVTRLLPDAAVDALVRLAASGIPTRSP